MYSSSTQDGGCGTKSQPWVIEAPTGQQIDISLLDFGLIRPNGNCTDQYGYILEKLTTSNVSICRMSNVRQVLVHRSASNLVEIVLVGTNVLQFNGEPIKYLIGFKG